MYKDFHMHSIYSPDGHDRIEDIVRSAIGMGLSAIAITDHCEPGVKEEHVGVLELDGYLDEIYALKDKYKGKIDIFAGIEIAYINEQLPVLCGIVERYSDRLEYIINSVHVTGGTDCFYKEHYEGRGKREVYEEYLNAVYESVTAPYRYDAVGHIGYITRYAPYEDKSLTVKEFGGQIKKILTAIIERGKILELNTGKDEPIPTREIMQLYYDLGGRKVALGSDAHRKENLAKNFDNCYKLLTDIGFSV